MPKKIIAFNWKMNPENFKKADSLISVLKKLGRKFLSKFRIIVIPPFVFLSGVSKNKKIFSLGAQDVFYKSDGAYTGEISPKMIKNFGVKYVILGHSERRALGETDEIVAKKLKAVFSSGLTPILCVGEPVSVKKLGGVKVKKFIQKQLYSAVLGISSVVKKKEMIVAYEPIWAIGKGKSAKPEDASESADFIKNSLKKKGFKNVKVFYGGSIYAGNINLFLSSHSIDGVLIGGASTDVKKLKSLVLACVRK